MGWMDHWTDEASLAVQAFLPFAVNLLRLPNALTRKLTKISRGQLEASGTFKETTDEES